MPFTFSHPLFSVPLKRIAPRWLSVTGLVLGSMIPDMEYFMAMESYRTIGHSLRGYLLQGVPLSIAFAIAFHGIVKPVLPKFMPSTGGLDRFAKYMTSEEWRLNSVRTWTIFLVSLFVGYWTHMFMDAWTHASGLYVGWFGFLEGNYGGEHLYQLLQYLFSLIGVGVPGLMLLHRYKKWYELERRKRQPAMSSLGTKSLLWMMAVVFGLLLFIGKMMLSVDSANLVSALIVAPLSSAIFGIFVSSLFYQAARTRKLKWALTTVVLMLVVLVLFRGGETVWTPELALDPHTLKMKPPQGTFQPLWNFNLWCWSAVILLGCWLVAGRGGKTRTRTTNRGRTPSA
ncbi:DUF4184 family protein [Paenibacillus rhizovicinus]|uniref:DUF4184 family protein n=1 Tax=Paenibacillus rhizovicinus TaxID=2704463 RepID=A0A6C0NV10_9BACL|nr:DUF4184 family protein [Paenibacillus rhizovicinus]QHW29988.1 DUF4184 family protein [Paenibacillus rhizovicinus]